MTALRDWARLDARWYEDPVLRAAARQAPAAFVMWPVLVGMAKARSHAVDNPDGRIVIDVHDLAHACCITNRRALAAIEALTEGEFIDVTAEKVGSLCIVLRSFAKWQTPRKSNAERKANTDFLFCREKDAISNGEVTARSRSGNGQVAPDIDIDIDRDNKTLLSTSATPKVDHARILFEHWITATGRSPGQNRLTAGRRSKVNARIRDGYTPSQLQAAIDGIASSAWHSGDNPGSKRYDTFDFIMRSGENVEKGIEFAVAHANKTAARQNGGVDEEATRRWYLEQGFTEAEIDAQLGQRGTAA